MANTTQKIPTQLENADISAFSDDEKTLLYIIVCNYMNRKKHDSSSVAYAVNAMRPVYLLGSREHAINEFLKHIVTTNGFYRVAQFRPSQQIAHELKLQINFPYRVTKYNF